MKKLFLLFIMLIFGLISLAQKQVKKEFDDLYYTPSIDKINYDKNNYFDADTLILLKENDKKESSNSFIYIIDNDLYYTSLIYRFHNPYPFKYFSFPFKYYYKFYYYNYFWYDPFWYNPFWYDSFWYDYFWYCPYKNYSSIYYWNNYYWNWHYYNNQHFYYNTYNYYKQKIQTGRRERSSVYTNTLNNNNQKNLQYQIKDNKNNNLEINRRQINSSYNEKFLYQESRRTYVPTYEQPRLNSTPKYNNTKIYRQPTQSINRTYDYSAPARTPSIKNSTYDNIRRDSYSTPSYNNYNYSPINNISSGSSSRRSSENSGSRR